MTPRGTSVAAAVLELLYAHPHQDTPEAIVSRRPDVLTFEDVLAALAELREQGFVQTAAGHWQLTALGFRMRGSARLAS